MLTELFTKMEFDFLDGVTFTSNKARFSPEKENENNEGVVSSREKMQGRHLLQHPKS